ncbi:MAG: hypothetical protein ACO1N8_10950 [Methylophilus sp.]
MSEIIKVENELIDISGFSDHIKETFRAYKTVGHQSWEKLIPRLHYGNCWRSLPKALDEVATTSSKLIDLCLTLEPQNLEFLPKIKCSWGEYPCEPYGLFKKINTLLAGSKSSDPNVAHNSLLLLAAIAQMYKHMDIAIQSYWLRCELIRATMQECELIANDFYHTYLTKNINIAKEELNRYLYPTERGREPAARIYSDSFISLQKALKKVNKERDRLKIDYKLVDSVKTERVVASGVAMIFALSAIDQSFKRGNIYLDQEAMRQLAEAGQMANQAQQNYLEAMSSYLEILATEAQSHPILLLLGPKALTNSTVESYTLFAAEIKETIDDTLKAIEKLRVEGACHYVIPDKIDNHSFNISVLSETISDSNAFSVWKLPFFVERAKQFLPEQRMKEVDTLIEMAAKKDKAIASALAMGGMDLAMLAAPACGPIGVGLSVFWGIIGLIQSGYEYVELKTLFNASINPAILLRGVEHEPASKIGILLSVVGVIP